MGQLCTHSPSMEQLKTPKIKIKSRGSPISKECDLVISPNSFIKKNLNAFHGLYRIETFSQGSSVLGEIRVCTHRPSRSRRVVKMIKKSEIPQKLLISGSVLEEVNLLKDLDHPTLPKIYELFQDDKQFYMVFEYCRGGDLLQRVSEQQIFDEKQACEIMTQLLSGVYYLHSKGIWHRDLRPTNLMLEDKHSLNLKIFDFESAAFLGKDYNEVFQTNSLYTAPEAVNGKHHEKSDLWSCGVIFYILISGRAPFVMKGNEHKKSLQLDEFVLENLSAEAKDLMKRLLEMDPVKRISMEDACAHPWIKKYQENTSKESVSHVISNLKQHKRTSKLKEAVHTFIITRVLNSKLYQTETSVFQNLDVDKTGGISWKELVRVLITDGMNEEEAEELAENIMEEADTDKSGSLDYTEFLRATVTRNSVFTHESLLQAFKEFDRNGDGIIDIEELNEYFSGRTTISIDLLSQIIGQADKNSDGRIDLEEVERLLMGEIREYSATEEAVEES